MINALGLLEVDGVVVAVDAADAMLGVASVHLLSHEVLNPGRLALVVEGDLAAYRAALDAGSAAAAYTGRVINRKEVGRPDDDTQWLTGGFKCQPRRPEQKPEAKIETKPKKTQDTPVTSEFSTQLLTLLVSIHQGVMTGGAVAHFGRSLDEARNALEQLFSDGTLRKRSSRCHLKS